MSPPCLRARAIHDSQQTSDNWQARQLIYTARSQQPAHVYFDVHAVDGRVMPRK